MEEGSIKYLEFIQNIITRMNTSSFYIKGWSITILSALLALYVNNSNENCVFFALIPTFIFWCLDSFYLQQERKFIGLYNDVINNKIDLKFKMSIDTYIGGRFTFFSVFFSRYIALLYGGICMILLFKKSSITGRSDCK